MATVEESIADAEARLELAVQDDDFETADSLNATLETLQVNSSHFLSPFSHSALLPAHPRTVFPPLPHTASLLGHVLTLSPLHTPHPNPTFRRLVHCVWVGLQAEVATLEGDIAQLPS